MYYLIKTHEDQAGTNKRGYQVQKEMCQSEHHQDYILKKLERITSEPVDNVLEKNDRHCGSNK